MPPARSGSAVVAALTVLVLFLQLPGPATCSNKTWRFSGLSLEALDAEAPEEKTRGTTGAEATVEARPVARLAGAAHAGRLPESAPPPAGPDAASDAGVTRAPPAA